MQCSYSKGEFLVLLNKTESKVLLPLCVALCDVHSAYCGDKKDTPR